MSDDAKPFTPEELPQVREAVHKYGLDTAVRLFANLDAAQAELDALRAERDEARAEVARLRALLPPESR